MDQLFLHDVPYHVHRGTDAIQVASWVAIALGCAALVVSWGRIIAWFRMSDTLPPPRLARHGEDDGGWFAEVRNAPKANAWRAELPGGKVVEPTVTRSGRSTWIRIDQGEWPLRLLTEEGVELEIPRKGG